MGRLAKVKQGQSQPGLKAYKKGGAVHDDASMDRKLIKAELAKACKKCGGGMKKK